MIVVDHAPHWWFLLRDGERLLLDVHCSHGPVDYGWVMALTDDERARYEADGRNYLDALAVHVQDSAPGVLGSTSRFVGRDLGRGLDAAIGEAIAAWRAAGGSGPG